MLIKNNAVFITSKVIKHSTFKCNAVINDSKVTLLTLCSFKPKIYQVLCSLTTVHFLYLQ